LIVNQSKLFGRLKKKLHNNQIEAIDDAVQKIIENPEIGELKKGNLQHIRVYKFKVLHQEMLLAYTESKKEILLMAFGTHENFYRDLKK